ncbi:exopolysaccharide biosynthesis polyprenyl glycosylphosphotransferase [Flavobacteriaceae bacterium]|nr:exopolysaccharide biosynthesis polyprenyl glycosylphosphotransferase [Flavobacteriaceae bacterium]MDB9901571.1 exopolysaccharide biosynthesis polyprenyl glycosylphosphotransferase [Flavobacteriaceae bacterium]MDC0958354.1 exopolysaccharide biosynthesis polyprenyl glycosylphosphotransferase [Flavobacteriaceae bacterium]
MRKNKFNTYFPFLYYLGEFLIILFSTEIMLYYTFTKWNSLNTIFIAFWFLISIVFKSHVLGRDISKIKLIQSTFKSLFFFSGFVSILNLMFFQLEFFLITIIFASAIFYFLMLSYRLTVDSILEKYRTTGGNILKCLIIGDNNHGSSLYNEILKHPELGYRSDGIFTYNSSFKKSNSVPFLGKFTDLEKSFISQFDRIYFSQKLKIKSQEQIIKIADNLNIKVSSIPDLAYYDIKNFFISKISTVPYISINKLPLDNIVNVVSKRIFDIIFSFFVIVFILSWMIPLFGLIIKMRSKGPVLFVQKREGYKELPFDCFKFRSMIVNLESDTKMADDDDMRLTKFGKFLRLSTLDEMPQFINVFLGDMSIVGPRPHPINLNRQFKNQIDSFNKRHRFKPGITGLAQSMGYSGFIGSVQDMSDRVKMDVFYFKNWSLLLDFKIVFKTIKILFDGILKKV